LRDTGTRESYHVKNEGEDEDMGLTQMNWVSATPLRKFSWRDKGILNLPDIDEFADRFSSYLLELFPVYNHGKHIPAI